MLFKTKDGTFRHPEVMALRQTLTHAQYVTFDFDEVVEHENRDTVVEKWLAGEFILVMNQEELEELRKKQKEKDKKEKERDQYVR